MWLLSSCSSHWAGGSVSRLLLLMLKLSIGVRTGGSLYGIFLGEQDFGEGSYLPKKHRALCWLHASGGPAQGWLRHCGHRLGKPLTPRPAMREGCRQCGLAQTSAVGAAPCPQSGCEGLARAAFPGRSPRSAPWAGSCSLWISSWPFSPPGELGLISPLKADTAPPGPHERPQPLSANQRQAGPGGGGAGEGEEGMRGFFLPWAQWWGQTLPGVAKSDPSGKPGSAG